MESQLVTTHLLLASAIETELALQHPPLLRDHASHALLHLNEDAALVRRFPVASDKTLSAITRH